MKLLDRQPRKRGTKRGKKLQFSLVLVVTQFVAVSDTI
jgi:hypothetical protein